MHAKRVWICLMITGMVQSADFAYPIIKHVVLISPDFITTPKDTSSMLSNWKDTPSLMWNVGLSKLVKLASNGAVIHKRGEEIAKESPGAACTIRKLFGEELKQEYGEFKEAALKALICSAVQPTKKPGAFDLLRELKQEGHYIFCVTAHDAEEHEVFRTYLRDYQKECFVESIDGVITLPHYSADVSSAQIYSHHKKHNDKNQWLIAHSKAQSSYLDALDSLLRQTNMSTAPLIILKSQSPEDLVLKIFDGKQEFKIEQDDMISVKQHLQHEGILPAYRLK